MSVKSLGLLFNFFFLIIHATVIETMPTIMKDYTDSILDSWTVLKEIKQFKMSISKWSKLGRKG